VATPRSASHNLMPFMAFNLLPSLLCHLAFAFRLVSPFFFYYYYLNLPVVSVFF